MIERFIIAENERLRLEDENIRLRAELAMVQSKVDAVKKFLADEREGVIESIMEIDSELTREQAEKIAKEEEWVELDLLKRIGDILTSRN